MEELRGDSASSGICNQQMLSANAICNQQQWKTTSEPCDPSEELEVERPGISSWLRPSRMSASSSTYEQPSRMWVDKGSFWQTLEVTDQSNSLKSSAQSRIHQLKVRYLPSHTLGQGDAVVWRGGRIGPRTCG